MRALFDTYGAMLGHAILVHTGYVLICVTVGFFLGLLLGVALSRTPRISGIVLPVISVLQTIPGLVFIGVLFLWLGMVPMTVIIALSIYAMFPVLKNTYTGDYITLYGTDEQTVKELGAPYESIRDAFRVSVPDTAAATALILAHPEIFRDYEITKGKMDDVFLAVTGKKLTGGEQK